jgi:hypothetical protein
MLFGGGLLAPSAWLSPPGSACRAGLSFLKKRREKAFLKARCRTPST